jgi:hypothetical protein
MTAPTDSRRPLLWLATTTIVYLLLNGAQIFETLAVVPVWAGDAPDSMALLRGPHALDLKAFWIVFHTVHELTFVLAIVTCRRIAPVRRWLLALFAVHAALRVWTMLYFAPTLIAFQNDALPSGAALADAVRWWEGLNLVRVALFLLVSLALVPLVHRVARGTGSTRRPAAATAMVGC